MTISTYVVLITQDHVTDEAALCKALGKPGRLYPPSYPRGIPMGQRLSAVCAAFLAALCLLAFATATGVAAAAQECEDCKIIKKGVSEPTPGTAIPGVGTPVLAAPAATQPIVEPSPAPPVVCVVLFWVEGCGHCHEVLDGILPQLQQRYGPQLEVRLVEVVTTEDIAAFYNLAEAYGFARGRAAVPFLLIGKQAFSGVDRISAELPGLIERHLAEGGVDWPAVAPGPAAGKPAAVPTDGCDLATPCVEGTGAGSSAPAPDAAPRAASAPPGAGISPETLALASAAVMGGGLAGVAGVRALRRRRRPTGPH